MASDITIICPNGRQLLCHRAVLSSRSKRLAAVFASGEYTGQHLPVSGVDSAALEAVVSSFYTGECPVSLDTVCAVHDAASKLEVPDLLQSCMNYIQQAISMDNVCTMLATGQQLKDVPVVDVCRQYIHQRFAELASSHDFHKQSFDVSTSILLDANNSGLPLMIILHVAAAWLSRQPGRDALKIPLLQSMNAPAGSAVMFDDIMARMSMMHGVSMSTAPTLTLGTHHGMIDHMGASGGGRLSVGNLVMPTNMNARDSMNGARLLPGPGMSLGMGTLGMTGGLESPLASLPMGMTGNGMGATLINSMQQSQQMYPGGMQQVIISTADGQQQMYHVPADNRPVYAHQVLAQANQHGDVMHQQHVFHMVNGNPVMVSQGTPGSTGQVLMQGGQGARVSQMGMDGQGNSPANGNRRVSNGKLPGSAGGQQGGTSSPGMGGRPGTGGKGAGSGGKSQRRNSSAGRRGVAGGEQGSEDDHSEATRSMPTNDQSDGERTSSAAAAAAGAGGAPPQRTSWFGMDGVLALAEAAEAAEQKQSQGKGTGGKDGPGSPGGAAGAEGGTGTPHAVGAVDTQQAGSNGSAKRPLKSGEEGEGVGADGTPDGKRMRVSTPGGGMQNTQVVLQGGQVIMQGQSQQQGISGSTDPSTGMQQVLTTTGHLLANGGQLFSTGAYTANGQLSNISNLSTHLGGNAAAPAISWDTLTAHNLGALGATNFSNNNTIDMSGGSTGAVMQGNLMHVLQNLQGLNGGGNILGDNGAGGGLNAHALTSLLEGGAGKSDPNSSVTQKAFQQLVGLLPVKPDPPVPGSGGGGGRGKSSSRSSNQPQKGYCHVDGCNADLTGLRDYHQRYKICDMHLKAPSIQRDGVPQRFCQQCGRFHMLDAFDGTRRSCRAMLQRHNARRNKRNPDALPMPVQDGPRGMYLQSMQNLQNMQATQAAVAAGAGGADGMTGSLTQQLLGEGGAGLQEGAGANLQLMMGLSQSMA